MVLIVSRTLLKTDALSPWISHCKYIYQGSVIMYIEIKKNHISIYIYFEIIQEEVSQ